MTQAEGLVLCVGAKMFSCCGARHLRRRRCAFLICDPATLRRELYDYRFLDRSIDGKVCRLADPLPTQESLLL